MELILRMLTEVKMTQANMKEVGPFIDEHVDFVWAQYKGKKMTQKWLQDAHKCTFS